MVWKKSASGPPPPLPSSQFSAFASDSSPSSTDTGQSNSAGPPLQLRTPSVVSNSQQMVAPEAENSQQGLDLSDLENLRWVQSRLQQLGYLRSAAKTWDPPSRSAREFKAMNNLGANEKWDLKTEETLVSGSALRADQTFLGSWSEGGCEKGSKPEITINSRQAVSSTGGVCEFSTISQAGSAWSITTTCSNSGEK